MDASIKIAAIVQGSDTDSILSEPPDISTSTGITMRFGD